MARKPRVVKKTTKKKKSVKKVAKKAPARRKAFKLPKTLGRCADMLYTLREERQLVSKTVDAIKAQEAELAEHLIQHLDKADAEGVKGRIARVGVVSKTVASVSDWDKFYKHILKTQDFSLMQRRANDVAFREIWEDKKSVPGVVPFTVLKISLTKA